MAHEGPPCFDVVDACRTAFDLDADDGQQFEKLSYHPNSLSSLFGAGVQSLKV